MWLAPIVALLACSVEKQDCPPAEMCVAPWDAAQKVCAARGRCEPRPAPVELELSLPFPAGDRVVCGKGNLRFDTSHNPCVASTRFAFDLISSAFDPPHLIVASADGTAVVRGGCASIDLNAQDREDPCNGGWGNYVRVRHDPQTYTQYAHLSAILVRDGQSVRRGQPIGIEGNSGLAGVKHLHWSAHRGDAIVGGPSVEMARVRIAGRVVPSRELVCGDFTHRVPVTDAMRLRSETPLLAQPEQFGFRALPAPLAPHRCGDGMFEVAGDGCALLPSKRAGAGVLIFLHGLYAPEAAAAETARESALAREAASYGFAFIAPRGRRGLCEWSDDVRDKICWPSGRGQHAVAAELAAALDLAYGEVIGKLGPGAHPRYLMGFSNGGFFASYLVSEALLGVDRAAILHGGPVEPATFASAKRAPIFLLAAEGDPWQGPKMKTLDERLTRLGWPHTFRARPGEHALLPDDVRAALDFFAAAPAP